MTNPRCAGVMSMALGLALFVPGAGRAAEPTADQIDFFEKKIRPVLVEHCYQCHSAKANKIKGGLRLDSQAAVRQGGDSGPALVPGEPSQSLLLKAIRYEELSMPPSGRLPERVAADFETWIKDGAVDPRDDRVAAQSAAQQIDIEAGKRFWAFQPPQRYPVPQIRNSKFEIRNPIDAFVVSRLEQTDLGPAPGADRRTWLRRVSFDLTGLPPTPEEVEAFGNDSSATAYGTVVERLLSSPHYGERWARVWLDVARFAEDQAHIVGSDASLTYPNAYLYRDWVIGALNEDLPYDQFIKMQLAADLLHPDEAPAHAALGYLGLGPKYYNRNNPAVLADEWEDRVDVVGRGLLGLTVACARCHDHKFDPIPTEDYYGLAGVFAGTEMFNRPLSMVVGPPEPAPKKKDDKSPKDALHIVREGKPTDLNVFVRGDVKNKGPVVKRHFLAVLCAGAPQPFTNGSGRLELAEAIASPQNPLTARVIVNRVWSQYFGRGIVSTPSNFGFMGERPTHPELLDDLAVRFMEAGWSLKWLHRQIVLSATYRQTSTDARTAADPENRRLSRMSRRRLPIESWRDAILSAAGTLESAVRGKSIDPQDPAAARRTVYSAISRLSLNRMLALFDHPDPNIHADRRVETTTPLQKLFVMNSPFIVRQAEALADRLLNEVSPGEADADRKRVDRAYRLLFGRPPAAAELRLALEYLDQPGDRKVRWQQYAHVLLASNEMLFLD